MVRFQEPGAGPQKRDLKALFRPPVDLITRADWDSLLAQGQSKQRWLLINVQDAAEFASQVLNRDVWSNETLKALIRANFLFWQVYQDGADGRRVTGYYNLADFPAVFLVDPRTGEMVQSLQARDEHSMMHLRESPSPPSTSTSGRLHREVPQLRGARPGLARRPLHQLVPRRRQRE